MTKIPKNHLTLQKQIYEESPKFPKTLKGQNLQDTPKTSKWPNYT